MDETSLSPPGRPSRGSRPRALLLFSLVTALVALRYLFLGSRGVELLRPLDALFATLGRDTQGFFTAFVRQQRPAYDAHTSVLLLHIIPMSVALVTGAWQFLPAARRRAIRAHRRLGGIYAASSLTGLVFGAYIALALPMVGSTFAIASNVAAGALGSLFVLIAVVSALRGDIARHGRFMLRSYAVLTTLFTLYAMVLLFVLAKVPAAIGYEAAHDLCLPFNLVLAELALLRRRRREQRAMQGASA